MPDDLIPHLRFDAAEVGAKDRLEAWRQQLAPMFDALPQIEGGQLDARFDLYNVGPILLGGVDAPAHHYRRDKAWLVRSDIDHYLLHLYLDGDYVGRFGERDVRLRPGDIEILHFGQTMETMASASRTFGVLIPKDVLDQRVRGAADLHGVVIRREDPAGALLGAYLYRLRETVVTARAEDAPMIAESCIALVAACLRPTADALAAAEPVLAAVAQGRIMDHIDARLDDPGLSIDTLCRDFRVSRSYLYRLFEPLGGVANHIRRRRLHRAMAMLMDPTCRQRRIADIAFACGFAEERTFSRVFRAEFGMAPSEARNAPILNGDLPGQTMLAEWILNLGRPARRP